MGERGPAVSAQRRAMGPKSFQHGTPAILPIRSYIAIPIGRLTTSPTPAPRVSPRPSPRGGARPGGGAAHSRRGWCRRTGRWSPGARGRGTPRSPPRPCPSGRCRCTWAAAAQAVTPGGGCEPRVVGVAPGGDGGAARAVHVAHRVLAPLLVTDVRDLVHVHRGDDDHLGQGAGF